MAWFVFAISLLCSYLLGSVNAAVIISKLIAHDDVRDHGSGNAGMTNVMRTMGLLPGILTLVIDSGKGAVACLFAKFLVFPYVFEQLGYDFLRPEYAIYYCGVLCLLGHVFPVFFDFRGGKGVATTLGIAFVCQYQTALIALSVFVVIMLITKTVSLSSIIAAVSMPFINIAFAERIAGEGNGVLIQCLLFGVISALVIFMHRSNIVRILHGEEKKFSIKKSKEPKK